MEKIYLGDGAYAEWKDGTIKLTAENGIEATDTIWLEPGVWESLRMYVERMREDTANGTHKDV